MRLGISKSKNTINYYIIKDYTKNGKRSTKHVERIGNLEEVKKLAGNQDYQEWLKDYVKKYNEEHCTKEIITIKKNNKKIIDSNISSDEINENTFSNYLDTFDIPDVDLMIRTGGEYRLSNFLLWQLSYSELFFTPTLWPEFSYNELKDIIESFKKRDRRFGGILKSKD